jgi:Flp pilus assembly protein TadD
VAAAALQINRGRVGDGSAGVHGVSVGLHAVNTLLVYLLALRLLRSGCARSERWSLVAGALVAALLWAAHPLRVEAVAWTAQRGELLAALFLLLATHAYLPRAGQKRATALILATLAYLAALLMTPVALGWPVVLVLLDACPLQRIRSPQAWLEKIPLVLVAGVLAALVMLTPAVPAHLPTPDATPLEHLQLVTGRLAHPAWTTFKPLPLVVFYEFDASRATALRDFALAGGALLVIVVGLALAVRRLPGLAVGGFAYLVLVAPATLLLLPTQTGADHLTYLTTLPLFVLVGAAIPYAADLPDRGARAGAAVMTIIALVLAGVLGFLTTRQAGRWETPRTVWEYANEHDDQSAVVEYHYGLVLRNEGELPVASQLLHAAARHRHGWLAPQLAAGEALLLVHQYEDATRVLKRAIDIAPDDPRGHHLLAATLALAGQPADAETHARRAVALDPDNPRYLASLGHLLVALQRWDEAVETLSQAAALAPEDEALQQDLVRARQRAGKE